MRDSPARESMPELQPAAGAMLVGAALRHGVAGVLHDALARSGALEELEPRASQDLASLRAEYAAQYLRVTSELSTLALTLDRAGIPWAVMKGPAVAVLGYATPNLRWSVDLDVLVHASQLGPAIDVITDAGATLLDVNWDLQLQLVRSEVSIALPYGTLLDLHWHPVNDKSARANTRLNVAAILSRRRPATIAGAPRPVLDPADNMVLVALHGALSGGHRLTWAKDLESLARHDPPDWELLVQRAKTARVNLPVGLMLRRAVRLLAAPVPPHVVVALLGGRPESGLLGWSERLATPESLATGTGTGRLVMSSLRSTWQESLKTMARAAEGRLTVTLQAKGATLSHGRQRGGSAPVVSSAVGNPLRTPAGGSIARARYLAAIGERAQAGHPGHQSTGR